MTSDSVLIPSHFARLSANESGAIDRHGDTIINVASDFVAQYTTRQEYRYADALPEHDHEWLTFMHLSELIKSLG